MTSTCFSRIVSSKSAAAAPDPVLVSAPRNATTAVVQNEPVRPVMCVPFWSVPPERLAGATQPVCQDHVTAIGDMKVRASDWWDRLKPGGDLDQPACRDRGAECERLR